MHWRSASLWNSCISPPDLLFAWLSDRPANITQFPRAGIWIEQILVNGILQHALGTLPQLRFVITLLPQWNAQSWRARSSRQCFSSLGKGCAAQGCWFIPPALDAQKSALCNCHWFSPFQGPFISQSLWKIYIICPISKWVPNPLRFPRRPSSPCVLALQWSSCGVCVCVCEFPPLPWLTFSLKWLFD